MKLSEGKIEQIKTLRRKGYSYREIAKEVGVSYETARGYAMDVIMSEEGKRRYEDRLSQIWSRNISLARKAYAETRMKRIPDWAREISLDKALVITSAMLDGHVNDKIPMFQYVTKSYTLAEQVSNNVSKAYGFPYIKPKLAKDGSYRFRYLSKEMVKDLRRYLPNYSMRIMRRFPDEIINAPKEWKRQILRRAFDEEGSVTYRPEKSQRWICLTNYSRVIRRQVIDMLGQFRIHACERGNNVVISMRENLEIFYNKINFSPGVKVSKGHWKGRDKRDVLKISLESYKR